MKSPVAIGLLLCEQVIVEHETRNLTPVNCFSRRFYSKFPTEDVPFVVFAILADGLGEMNLEIVVERLSTMDEVYRREVPIRFDNPLQEVRCVLRIRHSFTQSGQYQVSLLVGQNWLAHRKFVLLERGET